MVKWWSVEGITLDLEIGLFGSVFVKGIFKGSHLKNFKFILIPIYMSLVKLPSNLHQISDLQWADDIYVLPSISRPRAE